MGIDRISNLSLFNSTLGDVSDVEKQLATLQQQISSGLKSQDFAGLNGQIEEYTQINAKISAATQYQNNNTVAAARLQTADNAMEQMQSIASDMQALIVQARNATASGSLNFQLQMENYMKSMASQLNTNFDGKFLFGGTDTTSPPVTDPLHIQSVVGTPDAGYYGGSTQDVTYHADVNITYTIPVRADDGAFQKLFAAAQQAIRGFNSGGDADLASALDLMQSGTQDLTAARADLNATSINVQSTNDRLKSMQLYWKSVNDEVANTDLVAASTQVSNYQAILQATFQVYSRLSQLRLSDYLK